MHMDIAEMDHMHDGLRIHSLIHSDNHLFMHSFYFMSVYVFINVLIHFKSLHSSHSSHSFPFMSFDFRPYH